MVVGESAVAVRTTMRGTHRGDFFGVAPTGRSFAVAQMTIERFREGRIVLHHRVTDDLGLMRQLALLSLPKLAGRARVTLWPWRAKDDR